MMMKVKILQKCFAGTGGNLMPNEVHDIEDRIAEKLINRGYVEAVKAEKPKAAPKKTNRAVKTVSTPEDE
jgi:hypothetical protein